MNWNIAEAKQRFSEMLRAAQDGPQMIYKRETPVAAVIAAEELIEYCEWKNARARRTSLADEFERLRELAAGAADPLPDPERTSAMRPNAFDEMLAEETQRPDASH